MTTPKHPTSHTVPPPPGRENQPPANTEQAVSIRLSATGNPHTVSRGNPYTLRPFADLLDSSGKVVPGDGNWTLSTPITGVTVGNNYGYLNGIVNIAAVTSNMSITIRITPLDYPSLAKSMTYQITVRGRASKK